MAPWGLRQDRARVAMPRPRFWVAWALVVVVAIAATWWACLIALAPPQSGPPVPSRTVVTVSNATIGRTLSVGVTMSQPVVPETTNLLAGVVTMVASERQLAEGNAAYAVAGVPVVVVRGRAPFFRDLSIGSQGEDVAILQRALKRLDYFDGADDAKFGTHTRDAVKAMQRASGQPVDGVVHLGQLVALPTLPVPLRLGSAIRLGALLSGGEDGVLGATGDRSFYTTLSPDRFAQIPTDAPFLVHYEGDTWTAVARNTSLDDNQNVTIQLSGADGGAVCGDRCSDLPNDEKFTLRGEAVIAPSVSGPAVAAAGIRTDSAGSAYVLLASGEKKSITVRASQGGIAVVDGVKAGEKVVLPEGATTQLAPVAPSPSVSPP
ncbi:peptidoglycan-binding domain-containing protein [Galbitalea sp. SE-J8]|uniref:peptidoglycan-binding domain-containing protein n=1 Tax=Galbitalea sp. SE-J8 TaxID=3054952 RepID=UPI00259CECCC|nr:peptidoglycan-binding domain-containing protein [Galbitalea sp. SE-J8]MDM4763717.1 peptidoglycan-binding domain-containing protein [Galbitalea sp. SE-J8]